MRHLLEDKRTVIPKALQEEFQMRGLDDVNATLSDLHHRISDHRRQTPILEELTHEGWTREMAEWMYLNVYDKGPQLEFLPKPNDGKADIPREDRFVYFWGGWALVLAGSYLAGWPTMADFLGDQAMTLLRLLPGVLLATLGLVALAKERGRRPYLWATLAMFLITPIGAALTLTLIRRKSFWKK